MIINQGSQIYGSLGFVFHLFFTPFSASNYQKGANEVIKNTRNGAIHLKNNTEKGANQLYNSYNISISEVFIWKDLQRKT